MACLIGGDPEDMLPPAPNTITDNAPHQKKLSAALTTAFGAPLPPS